MMNRIYQGKVTRVEVLDGQDAQGKAQWRDLPAAEWQAALWRHHELFQDAVNYYTLCLAAMAAGAEDDSPQAKALRSWVARVKETWTTASRKAEVFDGPANRLAPILKLKGGEAVFEKAAAYVLRTSLATATQRAAALLQLLDEADKSKGNLNQVCNGRIAHLCPRDPSSIRHPTSGAISSAQIVERQKEVRRYHGMTRPEALDAATNLKLALYLTHKPEKCWEGPDASRELSRKFAQAAEKHPELKALSAKFKKHLAILDGKLQIPNLEGTKPSGIYPAAAVFKYFPCRETLEAFLVATKALAEAKDKTAAKDAIADARVGDRPHFDFFTNIAFVFGGDGDRETRAVWFEYDLAAFIEALKAPHRYYQDTLKREKAAEALRRQIAAMKGRGCEASGDDEGGEPLPGFEGDERIQLLETIVRDRLKWVAEAEGGDAGPEEREYTIRERTLRGFGKIRRRWRATAEEGCATEKRLLDILATEQTEHRDDFGSSALYRELAKPMFHPIWRDGGTQPWHADDPLQAWRAYNDLKAELLDKERSIRFTPAHPRCSSRFFIFPKKSETKPKKGARTVRKPGLLSRHEPGQLAFTAGVVIPVGRDLVPTVVRIHYAAPRLCRDQIRSDGDADLHEAPWLQPMMAALGLAESPERVNFANCRITLQPKRPSNIQLGFPLDVSTERIKAAVGRGFSWEKQLVTGKDEIKFWLRWPHEKQPAKVPASWHREVSEFRCIAVDLGQRNAGAYARLCVKSGDKHGKRPARTIGEIGGRRWRAELERSGLFRLPGEDAKIWREKSSLDAGRPDDSGLAFDFREELWGDRGRPARDWEADETAELMRLLEAPPEDERHSLLDAGWREELSFPEQNDKLLVAMRRCQSRIARLHRWCWMLGGDDRQKDIAWTEITECEDVRLIPAELRTSAGKRDPRVQEELGRQLHWRMELAPDLLVRIANRVLPLRGRSWRWERHPASTAENTLHHLTQGGPALDSGKRPVWLRGQRGLSLKRIEQVEELRKRFQSLNQSLRREVGGKAPVRRDETVPDTCPDLLKKLAGLKEQRINQTAHLILAEALGLRLAPSPSDKKALHRQCDQHGTYEKILDKQSQWIGAADFIVIENLSRYRASQGRAPRDNSRLMKWCHRAVRAKLKQLCEVFGLPVVETPAAYSSRFCSRSGVPGFRAAEVAAGFTKEGQWRWIAGKKDEHGRPNEEAQKLLALDWQLAEAQIALEKALVGKRRGKSCPKRTLLVPSAGGELFVPIVDTVKGAEIQPSIVQADVNAAINLGLRAVADPRLWEIHQRLRTKHAGTATTGKGKGKSAGGTALTEDVRLVTREKRRYGEKSLPLTIHRAGDAGKDDKRQPNFFADLAGLERVAERLGKGRREYHWLSDQWTTAEICGDKGAPVLVHGKSFWGCVKALQWRRVEEINGKRLSAWNE